MNGLLKRVFECGKIGVGSAGVIGGARFYIRGILTRDNFEEVLLQNIPEITPEKLIEAYHNLDITIRGLPQDYSPGIAVLLGASFIASGIYNLVKTYHSETD